MSQQAFRRLLLGSDSPECAICGIDLVEVLEAAHLVPHARGGSASSDNGRLLCANHHRAYDAGLYQWTGSEFIWAGPFEEPALGTRNLG
ncbi:HNH endonuclease [Brooklawnia sp.]|uniref:HNH endonuclease n=1 Tax=Brooklawnia sp. TaxID=2699740 RepID=UPI003C7495DD